MREIAATLGCAAPPGDLHITGVANLSEAGPQDISFLGSEAMVKEFNASGAGAVLVQRNLHIRESSRTIVLRVDDADLRRWPRCWNRSPRRGLRPAVGVDARACVDPTARIGQDVSIGAFCVVRPVRRSVAVRSSIPRSTSGRTWRSARTAKIFPNVTIRERIRIGSRVIINAGSVLGTDGFGYRWDGNKQAKIPQIGNVIVEDDVDIGSCVCIDRAKFSSTRIGRGTKIDNLVQIAHNVTIGPHSVIAGQAGLAGSASLGTRVSLGGQSALRDHVHIGDGAMVAACAAVANDIDPGEVVSGMPALPHRQNLREYAAQRRLPDLVVLVRKLEEEVKQLRARLSTGADQQKK